MAAETSVLGGRAVIAAPTAMEAVACLFAAPCRGRDRAEGNAACFVGSVNLSLAMELKMIATNVERDVGVGRSRISWGAVIAATVVSLGVWILLYAFGLAVGFTTLSPTDAGSWRATGIGTGIWSVIAPLIALFIGGLIASRESTVIRRLDAAVHGAVLWGLTAVLGLFLIGSLMTSLVGGAANLIGGTVSTAAEAGGAVAGAPGGQQQGGVLQALGINANDLVAPINAQLREEGRPEITAQGLQAALSGVINNALRTGNLNREDIVAALTANTALTRQDAQAVAGQIEQQWTQQASQLRAQAESATAAAADATAGAMWAISIALLLSLLAAVGGALLGFKRERRRDVVSTHDGRLATAT